MNKSYLGEVAEAEILLERLKQRADSGGSRPLARIRALYAEVFFWNTCGFFDRARQRVQEGLELARVSGVHALDAALLPGAVRACHNADDMDGARGLLDRMATSSPQTQRWTDCFYNLLRAAVSLREGRLAAATRSVDSALELATSVGICYGQTVSHLLKAEVAHEEAQEDTAREHLEGAFRLAADHGYAQLLLGCYLADARIQFDLGREKKGLEALSKAMTLGREKGFVVPYLFRSPVLASLCARALEAGMEAEYAQSLIQRCGLTPETAPVDIEEWPWELKIYTLGRFELLQRGEPVRFSGKAQQRPLAMLKALLAFGGRKVSEWQIADALWPDADGDQAHQSFATTLHRLRRLFGIKEAVHLRDGRLTLEPRYCWVDAWAFERLLSAAEAERKEGKGSGSDKAERAFVLYKGSFLPQDTDQHWTIHLRERLRSRYLRGAETLGEELEHAGQWEAAASHYRRAIEVDPLMEAFHRRLMVCYRRLDRKAEALVTYKRCRRILDRSLGIEPSDETEALRREIEESGSP